MTSSSVAPLIKLEEEEAAEVLRRVRMKTESQRKEAIAIDPEYPTKKQFAELASFRAAAKKPRGPDPSPDSKRLEAAIENNTKLIKNAKNWLFDAADHVKHMPIASMDKQTRETTSLLWLSQQISGALKQQQKTINDLLIVKATSSHVHTVLTAAVRLDLIKVNNYPNPNNTNSLCKAYILAMRAKVLGTERLAKKMTDERDAAKKRVIELEARKPEAALAPAPVPESPTITREKYEDMKARALKAEKLLQESGLSQLVADDAGVAPEIKSCLALMKKYGGPAICTRMLQIQAEQKKRMYIDLLDRMLLKPGDILCCKFMSSHMPNAVPMFALGIVHTTAHTESPGVIHVLSMFQNDGLFETGKRVGSGLPPVIDGYDIVTKRSLRSFFDKVFDIANLKLLHKNALSMKYTTKTETEYRDTLYKHTTGALINTMSDKRGFFTLYERDCLRNPKAALEAENKRRGDASGSSSAIDLGE